MVRREDISKNIYHDLKKIDKNFNGYNKIKFSEHHFSHAASAFYPSPFKEAIILAGWCWGESNNNYSYRERK